MDQGNAYRERIDIVMTDGPFMNEESLRDTEGDISGLMK